MADSMLDKFRNLVTGGASDTLKKAGQIQACPECGNVTVKKDPKQAAKDIDSRRNKSVKGNMGD